MEEQAPQRLARLDLYCQSNENMEQLDDGAVALTVTSPPYWNAIDYDLHAADGSGAIDYRQRKYTKGFEGYDEYLDAIERTFAEVYRVTKPGGFCAIVIGTVLHAGSHVPVPFDCVARMSKIGWLFHQDIIWHKCTAGVKRAGVSIQKPFPGYFYPNIMTEYILVFRKEGPKLQQGRTADERESSRYPINGLFTKEIANNVWHIAPVPPGKVGHPCPFPEEIPERLIRLYSYSGDHVLDPYVGSGQTTKVAISLGRSATGYDIESQYIEIARARSVEPTEIRKQQLVAEFTKMDLNAPLKGKAKSGKTRHGSGRPLRSSSNGRAAQSLYDETA